MNLLSCIESLRGSHTIAEMIRAALASERPLASKDEIHRVFNELPQLLGSNDHRVAVATVLALLLADADASLGKIRRQGLFRSSRYGFRSGCLKKVAEAALEVATVLGASQSRLQYLQSVIALFSLAPAAKQLRSSIVSRLQSRRTTVLKTLLALVDLAFAKNFLGDREQPSTSLEFWSAADVASAFSRIYMIARESIGVRYDAYYSIDDAASGVQEAVYKSLLADAAALNEFIDAEVMLDGLPYKAEVTTSGIIVSAIDPDFERSVRLGYIQAEMQLGYRAHLTHELRKRQAEVQSFEAAMGLLLANDMMDFVKFREQPIERLVFEIPMVPQFFKMIRSKSVYIEEYALVHSILLDNFQPAGASDLRISETLTVIDVFRVQRVFKLMEMAFSLKLESIKDPERQRLLRLRSTVIVMRRSDLQRLLELILSPEQTMEFLSFTTLESDRSLEGSDAHIDLQYKPFLRAVEKEGEFVAFSPAVVSRSNIVRSVQYASAYRRKRKASDDPMQNAVVGALHQAGFIARDSFEFNISGKRETDIFAYRDGVLLVFECKNAYEPCSPHEMRNSLDLLETAQSQLDIRASWLAEPSNQSKLFQALGWAVPPTSRVYTCTVTGNRLFTGYRIGAHPVRQAHELVNVLTRGEILRGLDKPLLRFWRSSSFQVDDLIDYLSGQSVIQLHHAAMFAVTRNIDIKTKALEFAQYAMDLKHASELAENAFMVLDAP